jgi:hypothetical protein
VKLHSVSFDPAAEGDRILSITGAEAAYLSNSRWVAPARDLFAEAAERAFDRAGVRLARRDQPFDADANLVLEVPTFEARYENGPEAPPWWCGGSRLHGQQRSRAKLAGETAYAVRVPATEKPGVGDRRGPSTRPRARRWIRPRPGRRPPRRSAPQLRATRRGRAGAPSPAQHAARCSRSSGSDRA